MMPEKRMDPSAASGLEDDGEEGSKDDKKEET
jgi:hypothetical protein